MECPLIAGSIAKKAGYHLTGLPPFRGQGHSIGNGDAAAHDPIGPHDAPVKICDVHRASFAPAAAGSLAVDFRHHTVEVGSLGQDVPVAPMGADHIIILPQSSAHPNGDCFLADGGMEKARDLSGEKGFSHLLFKMTDLQHCLMQ